MNMLRIQEFFSSRDQRSLILDTSAGMVLGSLPGLEKYENALRPFLSLVDGLVCAPGQLRRFEASTFQDAGLLMRMDWTNSLRGPEFVLPPTQVQQFPLFGVEDASDFGAVGMVVSFLLGYEEAIEAACLKTTVLLAIDGKPAGMPLVVEVRPTGPRVSQYGKAVELGASYALEGGADVIVVPYPGSSSLKTIGLMVSIPWLLKPSGSEQAEQELREALDLGCAGLWLDHTLFQQPDPAAVLQVLAGLVHTVAVK